MPEFPVTVVVPPQTQTVTFPAQSQTATFPEQTVTSTVTVDVNNLKTILRLTGWPEDKIDVAQAVAMAESLGYYDAVGDLTLTNQVWGPSIGLFQIRSYRYPMTQYQSIDLWRWAYPLRRPFYNCEAALVLSKNGTDWSPWSAYNSGSYKQYLGGDPSIRSGHSQAANWWK
ncbi:MAG TPA: hypothetical protein VIY48_12565 [Candidatus Paceibacterota bacterium]